MSRRNLFLGTGLATLLAAALATGLLAWQEIVYPLSLVLVWSIFAIGFDIAFSTVGLLSFGHAAFFGVGGYVMAVASQRYGVPVEVGALLGCLSAAALALAFAAVALRLSGIFFAVATLALAELVYQVALTRMRPVTGGFDGIPGAFRPTFLGLDFYDERNFFLLTLALYLVTLGVTALLRASPFGQVLAAIRQNPVRAEQLGYDVRLFRIAAFGISGLFSGLAGCLVTAQLSFVNPQMLQWSTSGDVVIMTVIGGAGTLLGPLLGVALVEGLRQALGGLTTHWYGLLGLIFIAVTLALPQGIGGFLAARLGERAKGTPTRRQP